MRTYLTVSLLFFLFFLSACTLPAESAQRPKTFFCDKDDCEREFMAFIMNATEIKCAFYDLDSTAIVSALNQKNAEVFLEKQNRNKLNNQLLNKAYDISLYLMHNKFCIFDKRIVWTGSWNPVKNVNHDNVMVIYSKYLAQNYLKKFEELIGNRHERVFYPEVKINNNLVENYFCPEDKCSEGVKTTLAKAKSSIKFMQFSFTDDNIGDLLVEKALAGIKVEGIIEKSQRNRWDEHEKLQNFILLHSGKDIMHHKVFIVDEETVITGSYNPTKNADQHNNENIIIVRDKRIAGLYTAEFNRIKKELKDEN